MGADLVRLPVVRFLTATAMGAGLLSFASMALAGTASAQATVPSMPTGVTATAGVGTRNRWLTVQPADMGRSARPHPRGARQGPDSAR